MVISPGEVRAFSDITKGHNYMHFVRVTHWPEGMYSAFTHLSNLHNTVKSLWVTISNQTASNYYFQQGKKKKKTEQVKLVWPRARTWKTLSPAPNRADSAVH